MQTFDGNIDKTLVDDLERRLLQEQQEDFDLIHLFTPGLYTRQIYMPAGSLIISKIHKTQHPFIVSAGKALVRTGPGNWELVQAPHIGITYPNTRRVLYILEDCIWATVHATNVVPESPSDEDVQAAVDLIEERIIEKNPEMIEYRLKLLTENNV